MKPLCLASSSDHISVLSSRILTYCSCPGGKLALVFHCSRAEQLWNVLEAKWTPGPHEDEHGPNHTRWDDRQTQSRRRQFEHVCVCVWRQMPRDSIGNMLTDKPDLNTSNDSWLCQKAKASTQQVWAKHQPRRGAISRATHWFIKGKYVSVQMHLYNQRRQRASAWTRPSISTFVSYTFP